jgi:RHS repeat-associated protein
MKSLFPKRRPSERFLAAIASSKIPHTTAAYTGRSRVLSERRLFSRRAPPRAVEDDPAKRHTYTSFGVVTGAGLDWMPFRFAGGIYDGDSGLVRFGARDYDPSVGRWLMKDPVRWQGRQSNLFVYIGDNPVNGTDPRGTWYTAACKAAIWAGCRQGCSGGTSWGQKAVCSTLCNAAGKYMFCEWHDSGEPEPQQPDGGMCAGPEPEPEPAPEPPCDPTVSSCGP